jgi:hypothetical protein
MTQGWGNPGRELANAFSVGDRVAATLGGS